MKNDSLEGEKKKTTKTKKVNIEKEVEEPQINYVVEKKSHALLYVIAILVGAILIAGVLFFVLRKDDNNTKDNGKDIELKHTEKSSVKSEGVYITDVSEVVEEVMPSIVAITSKTVISSGNFGPYYGYGNGNKYTTTGAGSGVIVATDDDEIFVLTNYHVVDNTTELSVRFIDDESYDAKVKGVSERKDIAVVSIKKSSMKKETLEKIKIATLGNSDELKVGNGIIAIGNALGYGQSVTTGVVSALNREVTTDSYTLDMIQIDAAINGGNSGGALLNSKGEVVGINSVKYSNNSYLSSSASIEGMGFAIPISDVEDIIKDLINGKDDEGGLMLGVEGYMTDSGNLSSYGLPKGFYISAIVKGGNAEKSDLDIGNIITEIDGNKVTSLESIRKVLDKKQKGDKVTLKIAYPSRNEYKEKEVIITLN